MPNVGYEESQAGESPVLRALLPDDPVVYVDVGVGDAIDWNVTWPFYKAGGHGLLVEPQITYAEEYSRTRPRDLTCFRAAHNCRGALELRLAGGATTWRPDWDIDDLVTGVQPVLAEPLHEMLSRCPAIRDACQLCSIDVEGAERQVLLGIDWATFRPDVLVVEYVRFHRTDVGEDISKEWECLILDYDKYQECCRSWLNIIYLRKDLWHRWEAIRDTVQVPHATLAQTKRHYAEVYGI